MWLKLTPVGLDISPALDRRELEAAYNFKVTEVALTDIMRRAEQSGYFIQCHTGTESDRNRIEGKSAAQDRKISRCFFKIGGGNFWKK